MCRREGHGTIGQKKIQECGGEGERIQHLRITCLVSDNLVKLTIRNVVPSSEIKIEH